MTLASPTLFTTALFDFDGVIVDSTQVKAAAFVACFPDAPPASRDAIERYVSYHGGVSRFEKFRYIHERILEQPLTDETLENLCQRYAEMVVERVIQSDFVPGAIELLQAIHERTACYVVSGTPEVELRHIVRTRRLERFFRGVYGSPATKTVITADLVRRCGARSDAIAFVGDSITDYEAAIATGIAFLGVATPGGASELPKDVEVTADLRHYRDRFAR